MRNLLINDPHLGVKRQGGTTKESREGLEDWMLRRFEDLINDNDYDRVIILGDIFDKRNVEEHVMLQVIEILKNRDVVIVLGNHDLGGIEDHTLSSAEFVAGLAGCRLVSQPEQVGEFYIVPHMFNQEEFDKAISEVPDGSTLLVHCNIDSPWSQGDHSLNLSKEQLQDLDKKGVKVISGHEHPQREYMGVTVIGNQFPSSIADCLSGPKRCLMVEDGEIESIPTWDASDFVALTVDDEDPEPNTKFVTFEGECEPSESKELIRRVAKLRKTSSAFILNNRVTVRREDQDGLPLVQVDRLNVVDKMMSYIPKEFLAGVTKCL